MSSISFEIIRNLTVLPQKSVQADNKETIKGLYYLWRESTSKVMMA